MTISAHPSPGFAIPPFAVEDYPIGSHKNAQQICDLWNGLRVKNAGDCHG